MIRHFILDRSEELFIDNGYQKTSMDMIARECGLSKPTLYNYFTNKYELFTSLYDRLTRSLHEILKALLGRDLGAWATLEEFIDQHFVLMNTKKNFLKMYFREQHLVVHENIEEHMTWHMETRKEMVKLLSRFLKDIIRPDVKKKYGVEIVASTTFNLMEGLMSDLILRGEKDLAGQKRFVIELLQSGVLEAS